MYAAMQIVYVAVVQTIQTEAIIGQFLIIQSHIIRGIHGLLILLPVLPCGLV